MADLLKFLVLREHLGDKPYAKGDIREAFSHEVAHLIGVGVLEEVPEVPPAPPPPEDPPAPPEDQPAPPEDQPAQAKETKVKANIETK